MRSAVAGDVGRGFRWVLHETHFLRGVGLGHQGAVFAATQAVPDPRRVLVAGDADPMIERATAQPAEKDVLVGQLAAILTLLFSEQ